MGCEIRKVPKDWEHPQEWNTLYNEMKNKPLFEGKNGAFKKDAGEWMEGCIKWHQGIHPDQKEEAYDNKNKYCWEWFGSPPEPKEYMPDFGDNATHLMLFETTSEGTPISPAFETLDEVCQYAENNCFTFAKHKTTKERWKEMLEDGFVFHSEGNILWT